MIVMISN